MSEGASKGFWMSATLHGAAAALLFIFTFVVRSQDIEPVKIFDLVAGEGDNFMATEAPALGTPGGVTVDLPEPLPSRPASPEPAPPAVTPVPPSPPPKVVAPPKPVDPPVPNFKKALVREVIKAESRAKRDIARERAAEKKRLDAEKKRLEDEKKRMTKEEFDRLNKGKGASSPAKSPPTKIAKIDAEGIAKGVVGGSRNNKTGGAGGKALTATEGDELERFQSALLSRLKEALDRTPGLDDGLRAEAEFSITSNGMLVNVRLTKSSRNEAFDRAVLEAISAVSMGYRPKGMPATLTVPFSTHDRNRG